MQRRVTVTYYPYRSSSVPMIRLRGHWLRRAGFRRGRRVRIEVEEDTLVLRAIDRTAEESNQEE